MFQFFKLFKPSNNEQVLCERRLSRIMKHLNVSYFDYNWDRSSCYISFRYQDILYKMEHCVEHANAKGAQVLRSGLDCLIELIETLEDLCHIIDRGTYKLEVWLHGMKQTTLTETAPSAFEDGPTKTKFIEKQKQQQSKYAEYGQAAPISLLSILNGES
ncbi:hypothetical protein [Halalkalibacter krulwichiae]|uniref:Uncharacterized protein n=1 Tax=Halalkalibacter krulwichiae TaxID=199441 RepID=A0A1X9MME6_9BACI|nr:hypothetical protein [Halalkalibacter krulwichiae]ARK32312.1 hypothetical protein BkAM31D_22010 [Halalkalibacter krulwichiae]